ncbi:hypothetical protein JCM17844_23660 [Iodidimonas gelatinilytica]|uniref:MIP18 family-like domain-containing protein n=1 Tax=Iodidimonas gelatinilytica TaxID=1236966 RepID=A0A5A7MZP2_9PROT|nr:SUF system Fe-S cluster assembly protein [Iodidimonas gelatinilytica]GEQ98729.1 hypothetical protein JCM17844_23660 [Iodidimonas gelatinilytica]GER00874.1 hypothetical protein JCM17845_14970 [Iodidimonas gelatinilytica]
MMDDNFKSDDGAENPQGRPVWSHKQDGGYLEDFLKAEGEADADNAQDTTTDSVPAASEGDLKTRVIEALRQIYDPEIPVNIYELGLIYGVEVDATNNVDIQMTLTTPHCPVAESMPMEVDSRVRSVEGVNDVDVDLVWDPPWDMSRMSDEARLELGLL